MRIYERETKTLNPLEKKLLGALWACWYELNTIRARDGVPYQYDGTKSSVDEEFFSSTVDAASWAIELAIGRPAEPWCPRECDE